MSTMKSSPLYESVRAIEDITTTLAELNLYSYVWTEDIIGFLNTYIEDLVETYNDY